MTITSIGNNIYLGLSSDTKPTNSAADSIFIETNTRRIFIYNGTTWSELAYATTGASDLKVLVKEGGTAVGAGLGRSLNFTTAGDFDIAEDTTNDEYDIGIANNAIGDNEINAHTTTKITVPKELIPSSVAYEDESNTFASGQVFQSGTTFQAESTNNVQAKYLRIATPSDPAADTGIRFLRQVDANNDSFADKVKVGGAFRLVDDFSGSGYGKGGIIRDTAANRAAYPTTLPVNTLYIETDTARLFIYAGSSVWTEVNTIRSSPLKDASDITIATLADPNMTMAEGKNIATGTTTGSQIGTSSTQKIGFYGATPIVRPAANADTSGVTLGQLEIEVNEIKQILRNLGLLTP